MRPISLLVASAFAAAFLLAPAQAEDVALVIGIDRYPALSSLQRAASDARAVGAKLQRLGYAVVDAIDVDRQGFEAALRDAAAKLEKGDKAVVYFAGHGTSVDGRQFLLLSDMLATTSEPRSMARAMIGLDGIADALRAAGADRIGFIIDANRDAGLKAAETALLPHLPRESSSGAGTFLLFATDRDGIVHEGTGPDDRSPNSLFTRHLLAALDDPRRTWLGLFDAVARPTDTDARAAGLVQTPAYIDNMSGSNVSIGADEVGSSAVSGAVRHGARPDAALQPN